MAGLMRIIQIVATILQIVFEVQEVITGYVSNCLGTAPLDNLVRNTRHLEATINVRDDVACGH